MNENWGLRPILFNFFGYPVQSYSVFMLLAIIVGVLIYFYQLKKDKIQKSNAIYIVIFALVGGTIGSKIPILISYWSDINSNPETYNILYSGRTILGGLIGGAVGTFTAKKIFKIRERLGNQIAIPVSVAMAIGRIGCLLNGCCYGKPTNLIWGIDFGDNIRRHPTQIYEIIFDIILACYLYFRKKKGVLPGQLFRIFLNSYLAFRFFLEFIREEKISFIWLTDFQLLCVVSLIFINRQIILSPFKNKEGKKDE